VAKPNSLSFFIVTYGEIYYQTEAYETLIRSAKLAGLHRPDIYIYDNTDKVGWSIPKDMNMEGVVYHHDSSNAGVSTAYNFLASKAFATATQWIVLLDQDTKLNENAVACYQRASKRLYPGIKAPRLYVNSSLFSPVRLILHRSSKLRKIATGLHKFENLSMVNSGLMIHKDLFLAAGGYNEKIKLDFADFDFIGRIKKIESHFEVLDIDFEHEASYNEQNMDKALTRYKIFLSDISQCSKPFLSDKFGYNLVKLLHTLKLSVRFRHPAFVVLYIKRLFMHTFCK